MGDYREEIIDLVDDIAQRIFKKDYYDLDESMQDTVFKQAEEEYANKVAGTVDRLIDEVKGK